MNIKAREKMDAVMVMNVITRVCDLQICTSMPVSVGITGPRTKHFLITLKEFWMRPVKI